MKSKLTTNNINDLKNTLLSQGIKASRVIDKFFLYSRMSPDFKDVLHCLSRSLIEERSGIAINLEFEANPSSIDGQTGLFYIGKFNFSSVDLILGFDNYSREWAIGDINIWRRKAQEVAFEDNWKRWIAIDFIQEINNAFSAEIEEDMVEIRKLFNCAISRSQYVCPKIKPGEDCCCPIKILVNHLDYSDLQKIATD